MLTFRDGKASEGWGQLLETLTLGSIMSAQLEAEKSFGESPPEDVVKAMASARVAGYLDIIKASLSPEGRETFDEARKLIVTQGKENKEVFGG